MTYPLMSTLAFKLIFRALNCCSNKHIFRRNTYHPEYYFILCYYILRYFLCITFCVKSHHILHYRYYYILRPTLLHFALLLQFVVKRIAFWLTITFCVESYYNMWRNKGFRRFRCGGNFRIPDFNISNNVFLIMKRTRLIN